ncbi:MAG: glycosyltransferase family 4 protein [Xylophilus sp.]|nr:glycosyltransferase family 4 protein [Xylophilus sp.]
MFLKKPKIVGLTQGVNIPSTRFRWQQYVNNLNDAGFEVSEFPSHFGAYAPASKFRRPYWLSTAIAENLYRTLRSSSYDLRFLQRNLTATLCTWEPLLREPFVFDVDDAIFLGPRGASAERIARAASLIICGNNFLAEHFSGYGRVAVLPTAVDTLRFVPRIGSQPPKQVIGWSGSSSGFKYLYGIEEAICILLNKHPDAILKVISDKPPVFKKLPLSKVEYEPWSPNREVAVLQEFSVGIMPLENDLWARGKCSFKMLTYMAVGIPVVVSPVGMNVEILSHGLCGLGAKNTDDWVDSISSIINDSTLTFEMGDMGRKIVEKIYARNVVAPQLARLLMGEV